MSRYKRTSKTDEREVNEEEGDNGNGCATDLNDESASESESDDLMIDERGESESQSLSNRLVCVLH